MFAKITLFPTFGCIFCQSHAYSQFLLHVRRNHAYSLHTHLHHHTTRGGGINHVYSHLFHVRRNHAFPTFSCMFAKFTLIPTFCCAKKLRNLHLFCETPSVFPLLLHVCQNHAYSHLLLHVRRNHVYSLHTQSIKEFLRFCEKSRKFNFTPHGAGV